MRSSIVSHLCEALPNTGIRISCEPGLLPNEIWRWALCVEKTATEQDLEQHSELEQAGDTLWGLAVGISHCPYCGVLLEGEGRALSKSAAFQLVNYLP
jgi:hypothetical protein